MKAMFFIPALFLFLSGTGCQQKNNLNLDFENVGDGLPADWSVHPLQTGFTVTSDSVNVKSGKYAICMEFAGDIIDYHSYTFKIPNYYAGKKITLSGYIKTENITDGFAGLWLMVEPDILWRPYILSNMEQYGTTGTNDWKKYEITLDMPQLEATEIEVGGLLSGKGKMWLDDLKVTIDGKDIQKAKSYQPKVFPPGDDKEFNSRSTITFPALTSQKIEDLELLGKIWGFLKYHHPRIAKGDYNWDYELFRILPAYLNATGHKQRDKILLKWINQYGKITKCKTCRPTAGDVFIKPDLSWIENSDMDLKLKDLLQKICRNRNQGFHYYVEMRSYVGNPIFRNEKTYMGEDQLPGSGFRLLALFRYWNMINYFYPYKDLTDKNWDSMLKEYIPCFIDSENRLEYELVSLRLFAEICDQHAFLKKGGKRIESLKGTNQAPVTVSFVESELVVTNAKNTGLRRGDIITQIDGKPVRAIVDSLKPYYPAANKPAKLRKITRDILRSNKDHIQLEYISHGKIKQEKINLVTRGQWQYVLNTKNDTIACYKFISKDIGYINLKTITKKDIPLIKREFINTKGIIIDIRNQPPDIFHMLAPYFVSVTCSFSKLTRGNPDNPGEFTFSLPYKIPEAAEFYKGKLVLIVNDETECNAEYTAMALQAGDNTSIVGSQTAGFDGNISEIALPGGLITHISGNGVYYPDGKGTQRLGIVPDIEIKPTIEGIREGRDELLEKAIEFLNEN